jgi:microcystin-dependent protein
MSLTPYMSEIKIFAFNFAPKGWALCNGQLLPINQNQALFSLLGTTYGGNGQTTFGLPDLRGRVPMHIGQGLVQGQRAGEEAHTLIISEMPAHNHLVNASTQTVNQPYPTGNLWATGSSQPGYAAAGNAVMSPGSVTNTGGSQAHENRMPYLTLCIGIALQGVFPSRN